MWFDRYALAAVYGKGRMVAYLSVTRYMTDMLGPDSLTKKHISVVRQAKGSSK